MWFTIGRWDTLFIYCSIIIQSYQVICDRCGKNEFLSPLFLSCEPTCTDDCTSAKSNPVYKNEPTCVCLPGYVRHNRRCIRKICCPKNATGDPLHYNQENQLKAATSETEPPNFTLNKSEMGRKPKFVNKRAKMPDNPLELKIYKPEEVQMIYILDTDAYPGTIYRVETDKLSKPILKPMKSVYGSMPTSQCEYELSSKKPLVQHSNSNTKLNFYKSFQLIVPRPSVAVKPPKCTQMQELRFCRPCCIPTCYNDCSNARCGARPVCVTELNCVCIAGYVLHDGSCIRKDECPVVQYEEPDYAPEEEESDDDHEDDDDDDDDDDEPPEVIVFGSQAETDLLPEYDDYLKLSPNEYYSYDDV